MAEILDIVIGVFMVILTILTITFVSLYIVKVNDKTTEDELSQVKAELSSETTKCNDSIEKLESEVAVFTDKNILFLLDQVFEFRINNSLPTGYKKYEYVSRLHPTLKINVVSATTSDEKQQFDQLQISGLYSADYIYIQWLATTQPTGGIPDYSIASNVVNAFFTSTWLPQPRINNSERITQNSLFTSQNSDIEGSLSADRAFENIFIQWDNNNGALTGGENDKLKLAKSRYTSIISIPGSYLIGNGKPDSIQFNYKKTSDQTNPDYYTSLLYLSDIPMKSDKQINGNSVLFVIFRDSHRPENKTNQELCLTNLSDNDRIRVVCPIAYYWETDVPTGAFDILDITQKPVDWLYPTRLTNKVFTMNGYYSVYKRDPPMPELEFDLV